MLLPMRQEHVLTTLQPVKGTPVLAAYRSPRVAQEAAKSLGGHVERIGDRIWAVVTNEGGHDG